jgi:uncharacterized protein
LSTDLPPPVLATAQGNDDAEREQPMNPLAAEHVQVETISNAIGNSILFFLLLIGLFFVWLTQGIGWIFWTAAGAVLLLFPLLIFSTLVWPRIAYRHASWRLDQESLEIRRGVFWKHRISIPLGRVQHADVSQGPLLRQYGLGKLTVHTAGTSNATIDLDGLTHGTALAVRDELVRQTQSKIVT